MERPLNMRRSGREPILPRRPCQRAVLPL